ncbi:hypothetical protein [Saccharothrix obliqua]|uniref:hypothetical protein n=1 Tax=Saccharothrix obliqua TaxID=2861747 RepID=UPI001C5F223F|nr:hypothetical protein [Saccharothrix obliqua]MBW4717365.1 hypothetical protein [Saccharothrix obliqua]
MATPEEIRHRIEQADTARSARRAAAAQQIGELAQHRATILDQLDNVERALGDVLASAQDVIDVDELAEFTDLKPADLTTWLAGRKTGRGKRRKVTNPRTATPDHTPAPRVERDSTGTEHASA